RRAVGQKGNQMPATPVCAQQVPTPVQDESRIGVLLLQHVVERLVDLGKLGRGETALAPLRAEASRKQQRILLSQRQGERSSQAHPHLGAGRGAPELKKAHVPLRALGRHRQLELRWAPTLPPAFELRRKARLPLSCSLPGCSWQPACLAAFVPTS